jgi:hypothetical protein
MAQTAANLSAMIPKIRAGNFDDLAKFLAAMLAGDFAPQLPVYTVATAPSASPAGKVAYFSNGAAGAEILAYSDGTDWLRSDTGAAIAAA